MDIFFYVGGAILGGIVAGIVSANNPELSPKLHFLISCGGFFGGIASGGVVAGLIQWQDKKERELARRWEESETIVPPQIVGSQCACCGMSIIFIVQAHVCSQCNLVKCKACEPSLPCTTCREYYSQQSVLEITDDSEANPDAS